MELREREKCQESAISPVEVTHLRLPLSPMYFAYILPISPIPMMPTLGLLSTIVQTFG